MRSASRLALVALLTATLGGCVASALDREQLPLAIAGSAPLLPEGWEIQALLGLAGHDAREDYLLAMNTAAGSFSVSFLSPQGVPVYSARLVDGRLRVSRQAVIGELLDPLRVLAYLELIYLGDAETQARLEPSWQWRQSPGGRCFQRVPEAGAPPRELKIHYSGRPPWYASVTLVDSVPALQLKLDILEAAPVLPE